MIITATVTREEAIAKLQPFIGKDLRPLADERGVTVWKNGRKNKGWAGQLIEGLLDHPLDNVQKPDFGDWDLKVVPLVRTPQGTLSVKETMAITMIDPKKVKETPFEHSHLLDKLRALLVCGREWVDEKDTRSVLLKVGSFDLRDGETFKQVQADYELVQKNLRDAGAEGLTGWMGSLVQPRTKGPGHGVRSHAFYARTLFVARMLRLNER